MRSKLMRPLFILAIMFASMLTAISVEASQESTPPTVENPGCGAEQIIDGEPRELPAGMQIVHSCVMFDTQGNYSIGAIYTIDATTVFTPPEDQDGNVARGLHISGSVTISVLAGSLNVALLNTCAEPVFPPCSGIDGTAMVGTIQSSPPGVTWTPLPAAEVVQTIVAGEILQLENGVTISMAPGPDGATISTYGHFSITGGGGCTKNCIQPTP